MQFFEYGEEEIRHLTKADSALAGIIEKYGIIKREMIPGIFEALVQNIIAQQISGKAADTIYERITNALGDITPVLISNTDDALLRNCGLSPRKVSYLKSGADFFICHDKAINHLNKMDDESIIKLLTQIKGAGVWTVEMLLIFSLARKNILSYNDFGIRKGLMRLHDLRELDKTTFENFKQLYSPYCSVASFYLWAAAAETIDP